MYTVSRGTTFARSGVRSWKTPWSTAAIVSCSIGTRRVRVPEPAISLTAIKTTRTATVATSPIRAARGQRAIDQRLGSIGRSIPPALGVALASDTSMDTRLFRSPRLTIEPADDQSELIRIDHAGFH